MREQDETIVSLAKKTGVPRSTISEWLSNRTPNPVQAVRVAKHLGVSLHYLLFGQNDSESFVQKIMKEEVFSGTFEISVKRVNLK